MKKKKMRVNSKMTNNKFIFTTTDKPINNSSVQNNIDNININIKTIEILLVILIIQLIIIICAKLVKLCKKVYDMNTERILNKYNNNNYKT